MSEIDQDLAARLLRAVEASPLKRAEVAAHSGIDKSTLTKLLAGQRRVSIEQLKALAGALGLKHTDFMSDPGAAVEPSPTTLPEGLKVYLAKWGDKIAPAVRRHLERSHFSTEAGDAPLDEDFWLAQTAIWNRRIGLPGSGTDSAKPSS